ncbi:hypothetical protein ACIQC9_00700 [Brevundimonas sp. NPDC092305]|uniref:hypothetical protein n=1 Tax=Brevundimonas sp. NPDC092305 TaxID=3363957 RepID=UPI00382728B2
MKIPLLIAACGLALAACSDPQDAAEDRLEQQAQDSATASGLAVVAFGLTEAQLLDAEIIGANGQEVGDVARVLRTADGGVSQLLVEIEDSDPDRFVHVPLSDLTPVKRGTGTDLSTSMTRADLKALPSVPLRP